MNKTLLTLCISIIVIFYATISAARQEKILTLQNEYNGKTVEEIYSENDDTFKEGIMKQVIHYDKQGKIRHIQSYSTESESLTDGVYIREQFYEHRTVKKPRLIKSVFLYTDAYTDSHGIVRAEIHYGDDGKKVKEEFWYNDAFAARKNYSRIEVFYNQDAPVRRVYYDTNGAVISTEEKKNVWKSD